MNDTSVFIRSLDEYSNDTVSVINSISIIDLKNENQIGGGKNYSSETDSYLTTTNDIEYGKKKKNKGEKKSLFRNRKVKKNNKNSSDSESSDVSSSSSLNDSSDSTSMTSDAYPLFHYYGKIKEQKKKENGRIAKSKKRGNPKKQIGGTRILRK